MEQLSSRLSEAESSLLLAKREMESSHARLGDIDATRVMISQNLEESRRSIGDEEERSTPSGKNRKTSRTGWQTCRHSWMAVSPVTGSRKRTTRVWRGSIRKRTALFEVITEVRALDQRIQEVQDRHRRVVSATQTSGSRILTPSPRTRKRCLGTSRRWSRLSQADRARQPGQEIER